MDFEIFVWKLVVVIVFVEMILLVVVVFGVKIEIELDFGFEMMLKEVVKYRVNMLKLGNWLVGLVFKLRFLGRKSI